MANYIANDRRNRKSMWPRWTISVGAGLVVVVFLWPTILFIFTGEPIRFERHGFGLSRACGEYYGGCVRVVPLADGLAALAGLTALMLLVSTIFHPHPTPRLLAAVLCGSAFVPGLVALIRQGDAGIALRYGHIAGAFYVGLAVAMLAGTSKPRNEQGERLPSA